SVATSFRAEPLKPLEAAAPQLGEEIVPGILALSSDQQKVDQLARAPLSDTVGTQGHPALHSADQPNSHIHTIQKQVLIMIGEPSPVPLIDGLVQHLAHLAYGRGADTFPHELG